MAVVKYSASAHFDIETEINVDDINDDLEIWIQIVSDLEDRYGLKITYDKSENTEET